VLIVRADSESGDPSDKAASEVSFARFFHSAPFGIATLGRDGTILSANGAFARMFFDSGKADLRSIADLAPAGAAGDTNRAIEAALAQMVAGRATIEPIEITLGPESQYTRRIYISPVVKAGTKGEAGVLYAIDATEQKALELKYAQSQKMEAVGQLAGGIAHDFNNVLTAILGSADLLSMMVEPDDPKWAEADAIKRAADRGAALTRQLLAFSRPQRPATTTVDLTEVVSGMEPVLKRLVLDKISIRVASSQRPIAVLADEASLNQIVLNLIINARDAMPDGGSATIDMGIIDLGDPLAPTLGIMPGRYAGMSVRDSGHGIPAEIQRHLFEPFFTTKPADKGTGLGLSIVYGIVKGLGGAIEIQSEIGEGATFTIYLPLVEAVPALP
jgi:two-component system, cell cycle sensor histidine kinase and response regulator CckA